MPRRRGVGRRRQRVSRSKVRQRRRRIPHQRVIPRGLPPDTKFFIKPRRRPLKRVCYTRKPSTTAYICYNRQPRRQVNAQRGRGSLSGAVSTALSNIRRRRRNGNTIGQKAIRHGRALVSQLPQLFPRLHKAFS